MQNLSMVKHKILFDWILIYFIFLVFCINLIIFIEQIRIRIAIILICVLCSFLFYPIYKVDKSRAADYVKDQKSSDKNQQAEVVIVSKENEETIENVENTETHDDFDIYCEFCGKKIQSGMKICPECGSKLES